MPELLGMPADLRGAESSTSGVNFARMVIMKAVEVSHGRVAGVARVRHEGGRRRDTMGAQMDGQEQSEQWGRQS